MGTQGVGQGPTQRLQVALIVSGFLPVALVLTAAMLRPEVLLWGAFWGRVILGWIALALLAFLVLPRDTSPSKLRLRPEWRAAMLARGWQLPLVIGLGLLLVSVLVFRAAAPRGLLGMFLGVTYLAIALVSYRRRHRTGIKSEPG